MSKGLKYLWSFRSDRNPGWRNISPGGPDRALRDESGAAAGSRCSVGRGPRTADRRPPTMSTQQILFQDQVRPRPRRERASGARPVHALGLSHATDTARRLPAQFEVKDTSKKFDKGARSTSPRPGVVARHV